MNREPWLTIIVPVYNRFELLPRTLDSVFAQGAKNVEVIISDDGSTENIKPIVGQYSTPGNILRLVRSQSNKGVSAARNNGAKAARGKWLYFLDSDDELVPGSLQKIEAATRGLDVNLVYFYALSLSENGESQFFNSQILPDPLDKAEVLTTESRPFTQSQLVLRADSFHEVGKFDEQLPVVEDLELWLRMIIHDFKVVQIKNVLVKKHDGHGKSLSSNYRQIYQNLRRVWAMHGATLKRLLDSEHYRRWKFAQFELLYWMLCVNREMASRLPGIGSTVYLCFKWAILVIDPPYGRRKDAARHLIETMKTLTNGSQL